MAQAIRLEDDEDGIPNFSLSVWPRDANAHSCNTPPTSHLVKEFREMCYAQVKKDPTKALLTIYKENRGYITNREKLDEDQKKAFFADLPLTFCKSNRSMAILLLRGRFQEASHQHSQQTCPLLLFYSEQCHPRRWRHLEPLILSSKNPQLPLYIPYLFHAQSHSLYGSTSNNHHSQSSVYHPCLHPMHQKNTPESSNRTSDFPCKA